MVGDFTPGHIHWSPPEKITDGKAFDPVSMLWTTPPVRGRGPTQRSGATAATVGACRTLFFGGLTHNGAEADAFLLHMRVAQRRLPGRKVPRPTRTHPNPAPH